MKMFLVLSESHLKVRKITVYHFVISYLVPRLLRFKDTTEKKWNKDVQP